MAIDDEDDLFNEEFDLVDDDDYEDDDEDSSLEDEDDDPADEQEADDADDKPPAKTPRKRAPARGRGRKADANGASAKAEGDENEDLDEYGRPKPEANYVVHIYEYQKFKRTLERPFTPEDAEAFASEYNRTGKVYSRFAVAGKNDAKPKKALD